MKINRLAESKKTKPIKANLTRPRSSKEREKEKNRSQRLLVSRMKRRIDSDLGAAIKKSCRRAVVDTCFCNDQAGCIGGGSDFSFIVHRSAFCKTRGTQNAARRTIIASAKRNGFYNFTGNFLSHLITPTITIVAKSRGEIKENLARLSGKRD
jgi:hypothetical protein